MIPAHDPTTRHHWEQLVTVALLGTDRRDPPDLAGPVGDLVADAVRPSAAERILAEVAAVTAIRRAGLMPLPPVPTLQPPRHDQRPVCPTAAVDRWRHIVASWPVLEDEWTLTVIGRGWRVDPEVVPAMLLRHRRDPIRWARAVVAAGPVAEWLIDQLPELAVVDRRRTSATGSGGIGDLEFLDELPVLPIPPDLTMLLTAPPEQVGAALRRGLSDGALGSAHRVVLVNLLARLPREGLSVVAAELAEVNQYAPAYELATSLADLARTRATMLHELERDPDGAIEGAGNDEPPVGRVAPE
jgi:hypothetical protein